MFYWREIVRAFVWVLLSMPCSSSYTPRTVQEGQCSRSEGKGRFYCLTSPELKFYLEGLSILGLSLKVLQ